MNKEAKMLAVTKEAHKDGDYRVVYEQKVFENVKAEPRHQAIR